LASNFYMLTTFRQSFKSIVQTNTDDLPTGLLIDMVVNPKSGVFEAFWVKAMDGTKLLLPKDIIRWDSQQITISDANDLSAPEDLPRLEKIFAQECPILKAKVFDKAHNRNIGYVRDFTFDTISPRLLAIEVEKNWFGLGRHRIPQHRIVKITPAHILVDSSVLKIESKSLKLKKEVVPKLEGPSQKEEQN